MVTVDSRQPTSHPGCGTQSKSRHSAYSRTLRDLSAQGAPADSGPLACERVTLATIGHSFPDYSAPIVRNLGDGARSPRGARVGLPPLVPAHRRTANR